MHVRIDPDSRTAPFEQVRAQIATQVADGTIAPGTRLPTVRSFAEQLSLATNTVARVYKELEADGVVETRGRHGTFVRTSTAAGTDDAVRAAADYVAACRRLGLTRGDALRLVEDGWESVS